MSPTQGRKNGAMAPSDESRAMRIVGINTDKCRRLQDSTSMYRIYFVLSENPTSAWRQIYDENWKALSETVEQLPPSTGIDGGFLYVECSLEQVSTVLPTLKKAVAETGVAYKNYLDSQAQMQKGKEDIWKDERESVEKMASRLHF